MDPIYPVLSREIFMRGIKKRAIANAISVSDRTLNNKMRGITEFTWPEVSKIRNTFFPDLSVDELFKEEVG